MRKPIIAGNWKMHKTIREAVALASGLKRRLCEAVDVDIVLCPPFTSLDAVGEVIQESNLMLGAQDLFWEAQGAYTGEISPLMLKDAGCRFVIIGHSERRQYFQETDQGVNRKIKAALKYGLVPIVCIGETLSERQSGQTFEVVQTQLKGALQDMSPDEVRGMVIAYEPVWAIGTGVNATPQQAQEVHAFIRRLLASMVGQAESGEIRIQYGGSVNPENSVQLLGQPDIDGALVGGASLKEESFSAIVLNVPGKPR